MKLKSITNLDLTEKLIIGLLFILLVLIGGLLLFKKPPPLTELPSPLPSSLPSVGPISPSASPLSTIKPSPSASQPPTEQELPDDPLIIQEIKEAYRQNPWLNQLPITTDSYVIVYDWSKEAIRIRVIIDPNSSSSREEQIAQIKKQAAEKLKQIGVDLEQQNPYYTLKP